MTDLAGNFDLRSTDIATAPLISVIIPCRNAERWIGDTLESVLAQRDVATEIIVVDDGSDDRSAEIAKATAGSRLRLIRQPKIGVSRARNIGTDAATGEFLQYLDADDLLSADTLSLRLAALQRTGADVAYCNWERWELRPDGSFAASSMVRRVLSSRPDVDLLTDSWWPPGGLLYRKAIVAAIGRWREDLPVIQDARFLLDAALNGARFTHVDRVGLKYRIYGDASLSRRDQRAFIEDCHRSAATLDDTWRREKTLDEPRRLALIKVYEGLARSYFQFDRSRFREVLGRIERLTPHYLPSGPPGLRVLSRVLGYVAAEHVALWWRAVKRVAQA